MTNVESEANKETSKNLTAQWMWNWPETFVADDGWQDFRSETLLLDTTEVLEEEIHLVMSEHLIVQTEENLDYPMTETRKERRSLAFASNNETSEELSVQLELLQEIVEVSTVLQKVQQGKLFQVTIFYDSTLLLEGGNKCFELNKSCEFVNEQPFAMQDYWKEETMHRKLYHGAVKHDKLVEGNARGETRTMSSTFGKKSEIERTVSLVEETIPSHSNIWKYWTGNGNSGMDAVSQANGNDPQCRAPKSGRRKVWSIDGIKQLLQNWLRYLEKGGSC